MRILHVSDVYLPQLGGIELHLRDLVAHQQAAGHDVRVLTATPPEGPDPDWVIRVPLSSALRRPYAALGAWQPDVVHGHFSVLSYQTALAVREAAKRRWPAVMTLHSMWSQGTPLALTVGGLLRARSMPVLWTAVSDRASDVLRTMAGPDGLVEVLPNAIDPDEWKVDLTPHEIPTIISVMRLTKVKRTIPLLRMLRAVRRQLPESTPLRAVILGEGPERERLNDYLVEHGMDWVQAPGRVSREEIRTQLASAWLFVAPCKRESFGISALEARTVGLPVVASTKTGITEFIKSGENGWLADRDRGMVHGIVRLLTDDVLREQITHHNRVNPPLQTWDAQLDRCSELYSYAASLVGR